MRSISGYEQIIIVVFLYKLSCNLGLQNSQLKFQEEMIYYLEEALEEEEEVHPQPDRQRDVQVAVVRVEWNLQIF